MARFCTFIALALVAAGAPPSAAPARSSGGWVTHRADSFSIGLPRSWHDASHDRKALQEALKRVARSNPQLAAVLDSALDGGPNGPIRFAAFDLSAAALESGFLTNLNIVTQKTPVSFEVWSEAAVRLLRRSPFVRSSVVTAKARLPAGRAIRLSYRARFVTGSSGRDVALVQYALVARGTAYVLTYTTLPAKAGAYRAVFDRSAHTFRFVRRA